MPRPHPGPFMLNVIHTYIHINNTDVAPLLFLGLAGWLNCMLKKNPP